MLDSKSLTDFVTGPKWEWECLQVFICSNQIWPLCEEAKGRRSEWVLLVEREVSATGLKCLELNQVSSAIQPIIKLGNFPFYFLSYEERLTHNLPFISDSMLCVSSRYPWSYLWVKNCGFNSVSDHLSCLFSGMSLESVQFMMKWWWLLHYVMTERSSPEIFLETATACLAVGRAPGRS